MTDARAQHITSPANVALLQRTVTERAKWYAKEPGAMRSWKENLELSAKDVLEGTGWSYQIAEFVSAQYENATFFLTEYEENGR